MLKNPKLTLQEHNGASFCLLLSCSQRKRSVKQPTCALELYDGYFYRIIRKLARQGCLSSNIDIVIVSSQYGILQPWELILPYDQKMTTRHAIEMRKAALAKLAEIFDGRQYREVFVNLGRLYLEAIAGFEALLPDTTTIIYAKGGIGQRGSQMKQWILSKQPRKCVVNCPLSHSPTSLVATERPKGRC